MRHLISRQKMENSDLISYSKIPGKTLLFAVQHFKTEDEVRKVIDEFVASKDQAFFRRGIDPSLNVCKK